MSRRRSTLVVAVLLLGASRLPAVELAEGVELLAGSFVAGRQPDGNTVVLTGSDGLIVVDTGRHDEHTRRIVEFARAAGQPVRFVVNTHWHLDHVGGNPSLRREFPRARVVSSDAIRGAMRGFLADYRRQLEQLVSEAETDEAARPYRSELAILDAGEALAPDDVVTGSGPRELAGRKLEIHLERYAVTAGDLWIHDPASRIVIAGDLVTLPAPFLDTACPDGWSASLARIADVDFTLLVPGHGPPLDRAGLARYRSAFDGLLACAASEESRQRCVDGWIDGGGELIAASDRELARAVVGYYVEQVLRGDPAQTAARCPPAGGDGLR
ncbi:MAG TPA: MBL fold metallo-hydrolase [Candidatus Polarisedimenticolaceae bacterium]|nr:MBL fold metallo-hydrolase [Candidatus Polarisedimenticolaceae bacterium]